MAEKTDERKIEVSEEEREEIRETARRVILDPSSPSVRSIIRVVIVAMVLISVFNFAISIVSSLTKLFFIVILAVFFAYLIDPLVKVIRHPFKARHLERFMPRAAAIGFAYVIVFMILGVAISSLAPIISRQAKEFEKNLPAYTITLRQNIDQLNTRFDRMRIPDGFQETVTVKVSETLGEIAATVGSLITSLPWLVLIPILAFFFLKDVNLYRISILRFVPSGKWRTRVENFLFDVNKTLAAYARAQLISCVFIGAVCTTGFSIIGLNYAILLGILAGVFEFVPLIGPLMIFVVAVVLALVQSPWLALYTLIFLLILRLTHDYVTYPRIVRQGIHLHPLAIIFSVLAGEQVAGIPGVFLSIPIVALLTVLYKHLLEENTASEIFEGLLEPKKEEEKVIENV